MSQTQKKEALMVTKGLSLRLPTSSRELLEFPNRMGWFDDLMPRSFFTNTELKPIKIEEFTKDGKLVVRAELPGIDPEKDISVSVHDGYLVIKGERREEHKDEYRTEFSYGSFTRTIALPRGFNDETVHADYKDGILEVSLDLPTPVAKEKKIQVKSKK